MSDDKELQEGEPEATEVEEPTEVENPSDDLPDYDTLLAENKELRGKVKKLDGARIHYKKKYESSVKPKQETESKPDKPTPTDNAVVERLELKVDGYSKDEIDFIMENGGKKILDNPIFQAAIAKVREDVKLEKATDIKSGGGSTKEKIYSDEELAKMPLDKLEKKIRAGEIKG